MLDNSLLRSNFVGRDGFRWWVGQIPPEDSQTDQINKDGWGNRVKVRIMGYHPFDDADLTNDDLPWAQILLPTTSGSGAANQAINAKVQPGDTVMGFFLDGDNGQLPVIMGVFGRTSEVSTEEYTSPFVPFTGYTSKIENDGSRLKPDQTNEQTEYSQKSPYHIPQKKANKIDEISYFSGIGDVVQFASNTSDSFVNKISTEMENVFKFVDDLKSFKNLDTSFVNTQIDNTIDEVSKKIQGIAGGIINGVINDAYTQMSPVLNKGVTKLYQEVYDAVLDATNSIREAHLAGVAAQLEVTPSIQSLQNAFPQVFFDIFELLLDIIKGMMSGLLKSATSFATCLADQFVGGLFNKIIDSILDILGPFIDAVSAILKFTGGFDLEKILRNSFTGLAGVPINPNFKEPSPNVADEIKQWTTGGSARCSPPKDLKKIVNVANKAKAAASGAANIINQVVDGVETVTNVSSDLINAVGSMDIFSSSISSPNFKSSLDSCYGGPQLVKKPPKINVIGSKCKDSAVIKPVYGSKQGNTASIIGAVVTYGGSCYENPPQVDVRTNDGYGAIIKTVINKKGSVVAAYVVSDGLGYIVGDELENVTNVTITDTIVLNPGTGYQNTDVVVDNLGNQYEMQVYNGSIIKVYPINITNTDDLPKISVKSKTGSGAIIKPIFGVVPTEELEARKLSKIQSVVDCITK